MSVLPVQLKPASYYGHARLDLVDALPHPYGRVLDIGCGGGATGEELLRRGADEIVGIELDPDAAEMARGRGYGAVIVGDAEEAIADLEWNHMSPAVKVFPPITTLLRRTPSRAP